mmetsp:Transcript_4065/g.9248  ORF Transcript_4065/g.9248 Transcript_4065/m.9248 type:complete len:101 (+) Transcript_4065:342-644(+)
MVSRVWCGQPLGDEQQLQTSGSMWQQSLPVKAPSTTRGRLLAPVTLYFSQISTSRGHTRKVCSCLLPNVVFFLLLEKASRCRGREIFCVFCHYYHVVYPS